MINLTNKLRALYVSLALAGLLGGCGVGEPLTSEQLLDPAACADCHNSHYRQWSGSMHAYAGEDPVFLAMNERGQRETEGALGSFCVDCHAPMAVRTGATTDGLNLPDLAPKLRGVTCAFCHRVESIEDDHNALMTLGPEGLLLGGFSDPMKTRAHDSAYSELHDRNQNKSATLCGSCHDVVNGHGVRLERTFSEWKETLFSHEGLSQLTCGNCHMRGKDGPAYNGPGSPTRRVHDHSMVGVDTALTPFPEIPEQLEETQALLDTTLLAELCVTNLQGLFLAEVTLENVSAGHNFPSGSSQDRRVWVELRAWNGDELLLTSGVLEEEEDPVATLNDPNLWLFRDVMTDADGNETHMFWEAEATSGTALPGPVTNDPTDPAFVHWLSKTYPLGAAQPTKVTMKVRVRPMGKEVLQSLVNSGDLDPDFLDVMPTFDLASTELEWTLDSGLNCVE